MQVKRPFHLLWQGGLIAVALFLLLILQWPMLSTAEPVRSLGAFERISVGTNGLESDGDSYHPYASADGRYVGFISFSTNLVPETITPDMGCLPTFICVDVFLRDRVANTTVRVSNDLDGNQGNNKSGEPQLSSDGSLVHFTSFAGDLIPDDTNENWPFYISDGFLWSRLNGSMRRVTTKQGGAQIPVSSTSYMPPIGTMSYFQTHAPEVVPGIYPDNVEVYRYDFATQNVTHVPIAPNNGRMNNAMVNLHSDNSGRLLVFTSWSTNLIPGDYNDVEDIFIHDTQTGITKLVSRTPTGQYGDSDSGAPMISPNGTHIVFRSRASNLVSGDTNGVNDVFMYDVATELVTRVSVSANGAQGNLGSKDPAVCNDGEYISFGSDATNIVAGDTNNTRDIFIRHIETGWTEVLTRRADGVWHDNKGHKSRFIDDCSGIMFASDSDILMAEDNNGVRDLFYRPILRSADILASQQLARGAASPSDTITYTVILRNTGGEATNVNYSAMLPANTTFGHVDAPVTYSAGSQQFSYNGSIPADSSITLTFSVVVDSSLSGSAIISLTGQVADSRQTVPFESVTIINGQSFYLPIMARE
ncbi:MAG: hypothetical protein ACPG8W_10405 [Candidatus Promineifilaceae bacterium]